MKIHRLRNMHSKSVVERQIISPYQSSSPTLTGTYIYRAVSSRFCICQEQPPEYLPIQLHLLIWGNEYGFTTDNRGHLFVCGLNR